MANISELGGLQQVEQLDLDMYPDATLGKPLPQKGVYTLQTAPEFPPTSFGRSKKGALSAQIDPTIVEPSENAGYKLRFSRIYATTYKRNGLTASQFGDYLRACGFRGKLASEQEQADAIEQTANQTFKALLDWEARNNRTGFEVKGMENFPKAEDGTPQGWVVDPNELDAEGNPLRLRARLVIRQFIPAE